MTRKSKARYGLKRTYKINPTVKALRSALFLGVAAAAASSAQAACTLASPTLQTVTCSGNFTATLDSSVELDVLIPADPTVVVLDASVNVSTVSYDFGEGAVFDEGAVFAFNGGDFTLTNSGNLFTENGAIGDNTGEDNFYALGVTTAFIASSNNDLSFTNNGNIVTENEDLFHGSFDAVGVDLSGDSVTVQNSGLIAGRTRDRSYAKGIDVTSGLGDINFNNLDDGKIYARSYTGGEFAWAISTWGEDGNTSITNDGLVEARAEGEDAIAIHATTVSGDITVTNNQYGSIAAIGGEDATGIDVTSQGGLATVVNGGDISALAGEDAYAIYVNTASGDISVTNSQYGSLEAFANWDAYGVHARSGSGKIAISNSGQILADTVVESGDDAFGIFAYSQTKSVTVTNNQGGSIKAFSDENAYGVYADSDTGAVTVTNYGDIIASTLEANEDDADGVYASSRTGAVTVTNSGYGSILAESSWDAYGIEARSDTGKITVNNSGDIVADASSGDDAWGVYAYSWGSGDVSVTNSGYVKAVAGEDYSSGIYASTLNGTGNIAVVNTSYGEIVSIGSQDATGISAKAEEGRATVSNYGDIFASSDGWTVGIAAQSDFDTVTVSNFAGGNIEAESVFSEAYGVKTLAGYGSLVSNAGEITAYSEEGRAYGIYSNAWDDASLSITNAATGKVFATSQYGDFAVGIYATQEDTLEDGGITIANAGSITSTADYGSAFGISAVAYDLVGYGDIAITNSGSIVASGANEDALDMLINQVMFPIHVVGINAEADDLYDYGSIVVGNSGTIGVDSQYGNVAGMQAFAASLNDYSKVSLSNSKTITASSDYGMAFGVLGAVNYVNDYGLLSVANTGTITATGVSAAGIDVGAFSVADYGDLVVSSTGTITVTGTADYGDAVGIGAVMYGLGEDSVGFGDLSITTSGTIAVTAQGDYGTAYGLGARMGDFGGYGDIMIANGAKLTVNATGDYGTAYGIAAYSEDGSSISITNSGDIWANASNDYGVAFGIFTDNDANNTVITNSGSIKGSAADDESAWAIYHTGGKVAISNTSSGKVFGTIQTDAGNDTFSNAGKWYATEGASYVSDFGAGNDSIVNSATGKIYMEDSIIDLGAASAYGSNSFLNDGKIFVDGGFNRIDMGTTTSIFTNNGTSLHFEDGTVGDKLTIFGDFAGTGHIVVDANGTSMLADRLYIDGDVVTNTANVIDVFMEAYPSLQDMVDGELIDVVKVSGTSAAANFAIGEVTVTEDALFTVDVSVVNKNNFSGTNDLFSLGFEVTGLSTTGVATSSIAPAVQSLWHLGVGTVFQRQGASRDGGTGAASNGMMSGFKAFGNNAMQVADYQGASGVWLRGFTEDGNVNPDASRNNFGMGGEQGFELKNSGIEFGAGYAFNDEFTAGLLAGKSESTLRPDTGGRAKIDADTIGGYVTYTPGNGFYVDFSYRTMDFDGNGNAGGDEFRFKGDANGFSLEAGYGFKTASGLVVEPQFQFSSMDVNLDALDYAQGDFELADGDSSQMRAGVALRKTFQAGSGDWTPFASLSFVNETDASNSYLIGGVLTGNVDTSGNSTLLEAGVTAHYGNMVFSGGVNWKDGGAYDSLFGGQVSVRFTW